MEITMKNSTDFSSTFPWEIETFHHGIFFDAVVYMEKSFKLFNIRHLCMNFFSKLILWVFIKNFQVFSPGFSYVTLSTVLMLQTLKHSRIFLLFYGFTVLLCSAFLFLVPNNFHVEYKNGKQSIYFPTVEKKTSIKTKLKKGYWKS